MKKNQISLTAVAALLAAHSTTTLACDLCSLYVAQRAKGEMGPGYHSGVSEQFTHFGTLSEEGDRVSNSANQFLDSSITQFFLAKAVSPNFNLQANLPLIVRNYSRPEDSDTLTGLGDAVLSGRYTLYEDNNEHSDWRLSLVGGLKLPTGSAKRISEELHEEEGTADTVESGIHGHDLALGTGSTDIILGLNAEVNLGSMSLPVSLQYTLRTPGSYGYQYANDLTWQINPGYFVYLEHEGSLSVGLGVSGELKGKDTLGDQVAEDTAITSVYAGPQASGTWGDRLSGSMGIELPVLTANSALQIVPNSRVRASLNIRL